MTSPNITRREELCTTAAAATVAGTVLPRPLYAADTQSERKLRIGVVGGGFGASFYWHQHPNCIVTGVTDLRADRRDYLRNYYQCDQVYDSMEIMLKQARDIDAVAVFTEAPNHVRHCLAALHLSLIHISEPTRLGRVS